MSIDLSYALIAIPRTEKSTAFLQGQVTCLVGDHLEKEASFGAHCNAKGRLMSFFILFVRGDHYYLLLPTLMQQPTYDNLFPYARLSRVALTCLDVSVKGVVRENATPLKISHYETSMQIDYVGNRAFVIDWNNTQTHKAINWDDWHVEDMLAKIPRIYPETRDKFLPHYLGLLELAGAVRFDKGCYIGQEIIARMEFRGNVKKGLVLLRTTEDLSGAMLGEKIVIEGIDGVLVDKALYQGEWVVLVVQ
jgi:folate-binding protein YgfZ